MIANSLNAFFGGFAALSFDAMNPRDPAIVKMLGLGRQVRSGVRVDGDTVLGYPAVFRGVNIIGNGVMKVRPLIYRRTNEGKERDNAHPSWKCVTRRANDQMSAGQFRKTLTAHALLHGNGGGYIFRDVGQKIVDLVPFVPGKWGMAVLRDGRMIDSEDDVKQGDVIRYWVNVGGERKPLAPENVIHIKGLSHNGYWGVSVIDLLAESLGLGIAARDFGAAFYGQGATATGIVFGPPGLKEEQQKAFAAAVAKGAEGLGRSHKLMILEDGANYQQLTIDPEKAQMLQTREFERVEVANIIGIQAHKLGDSSRVAYNSLEQSNQEHLDDDLDPWLQVWEDELEAKCLTHAEQEDDTHLVEFNREQLVRVNLEAQTARDTFERTHGLATANDILRRHNMNPIGEAGETFMVPANMTLMSKDGLPIMQGTPTPNEPPPARKPQEPPQRDRRERAEFNELALHEVERLAVRACKEAREQSRGGPGKFVEWLDRLPNWPKKPAAIESLLSATILHIHRELDAFTKAPHAATQLEENVTRAADGIQASAIQSAREQLEAA